LENTVRLKKILPAFMLPLLTACSPANLLNLVTPSGSFSKASDISYGTLERHTLDIYAPDKPRAGAPIVMFTHGGSWTDGSKNLYKFFAEGLTSEGFEVVVPNYRLYPEVKYPGFIEDTALAASFTAMRYPDRPLVLIGHSAGAYNTLMTILDERYFRELGVDMCRTISGVVSMSAPTGIIPLAEEPYITIFPDRFTKTDAPLNIVKSATPPILFLHGGDDNTVYPRNSSELADKIVARGGQAEVKLYPKLNHTDVVKVMSRHFDGGSELKSDLVDFLAARADANQNFCQ